MGLISSSELPEGTHLTDDLLEDLWPPELREQTLLSF